MVTVASLNCPNALVRFARDFCQRKSDVGFSKVQWLPAPASNMPRDMQEFRTRERCEFAQKNRWRMTIENDGTANLLALVSRLQRKILAIIGTRPKGGLPQHHAEALLQKVRHPRGSNVRGNLHPRSSFIQLLPQLGFGRGQPAFETLTISNITLVS